MVDVASLREIYGLSVAGNTLLNGRDDLGKLKVAQYLLAEGVRARFPTLPSEHCSQVAIDFIKRNGDNLGLNTRAIRLDH